MNNTMPRPVNVSILLTLPFGLWAVMIFGKGNSSFPSVLTMMGAIATAMVGWIMTVG